MKFSYTGGNSTDLISFEEPAEEFIEFCIKYNQFEFVSFDFDETITLPSGIDKYLSECMSHSSLDPWQAVEDARRKREKDNLKQSAEYSCSFPPPPNSERHLFVDFKVPGDIFYDKIVEYIRDLFVSGCNIFITTLRSREFNEYYGFARSIEYLLQKNNINIPVFYTTGEPKSEIIKEHSKGKSVIHFDDSKAVLLECISNGIACMHVSSNGKLYMNSYAMNAWYPKITLNWRNYVKDENKR